MTELKDVVPSLFKKQPRIMRPAEVFKAVGLSGATVWRLRRRGEFPSPVRLSANRIGWHEDAVNEWIASRQKVEGE